MLAVLELAGLAGSNRFGGLVELVGLVIGRLRGRMQLAARFAPESSRASRAAI